MKFPKYAGEKVMKYFYSKVRRSEYMKWKDNSEVDLKIAYEYANWIKLAQHSI
jgi:hypothetical protein